MDSETYDDASIITEHGPLTSSYLEYLQIWKKNVLPTLTKNRIAVATKSHTKNCNPEVLQRLEKGHWHKCIISDGDYFEWDKINID